MKTLITNKLFAAIIFVLTTNGLFAQTTINVPGQFPNTRAALESVVANEEAYPAGSEIIVKISGEGYTVGYEAGGDPVQSYLNFGGELSRPLTITIEGDGADVTTIRGFATLEDMPEIRFGGHHNIGMRFWQANSAHSGLHLTIKNLKLEKWGFGNTNGGVINFHQNSDDGMTLIVENVEFEHMMARAGSVIQIFHNVNELHIDNIFVHNSIVFDNNTYSGLFHINNVKEASILNSTFMSNEGYSINIGGTDGGFDRGLRNGLVAWIRHGNTQHEQPMNVVIENNAFINNMPVETSDIFTIVYGDGGQIDIPVDIEQPAISFAHEGGEEITSVMNILMRNNIMIENRRGMETLDTDVVLQDSQGFDHRLVLQYPEEGNYNILNSILSGQGTGEAGEYNPIAPTGFKISWDYTYAHPDIDFTMDGDLPQIFFDEFGVGYVEYSGDGGVPGDVVTNITLTADQDWVLLGGTLQISAHVEPENATDTSVTWDVEFVTGVAIITQTGLLTGAQLGTVTVIATANDGSGVTGTLEIEVVEDDVSVNDFDLAALNVFPNPSNGLFEVKLHDNISYFEYEVFNLIGSKIKSGYISGNHGYLDMKGDFQGIYLLRIKTNEQDYMLKLVVN